MQEGVGIVFLLPRPVNVGKQHIEHVALGHAAAGVPISGMNPPFAFSQPMLIYGTANTNGCLCGFVNIVDQPTLGQMRLLPGFSWDDLRENWKSELDSSEMDAKVLALGISLLFVFHGRFWTTFFRLHNVRYSGHFKRAMSKPIKKELEEELARTYHAMQYASSAREISKLEGRRDGLQYAIEVVARTVDTDSPQTTERKWK
jgi:hypothetical protein